VVTAAQAAFGRHHSEGQAGAAMRAIVAQRVPLVIFILKQHQPLASQLGRCRIVGEFRERQHRRPLIWKAFKHTRLFGFSAETDHRQA